MKLFLNLLFFSLFTSSLWAQKAFTVEDFIAKLLPIITKPIYELDTQALPRLTKALLGDTPQIKALKIIDTIDNSTLFTYEKTPKRLLFNTKLSDHRLKTLLKKELPLLYEDETIAHIFIYYQNSPLTDTTKELTLEDVLPIKQIIITLIILVVLVVLMLRYLRKKEAFNLSLPLFIFIALFLIFTLFVTIFALKNIELTQLNDTKNSLQTISKATHTSLRQWFNLQRISIAHDVHQSFNAQSIQTLLKHEHSTQKLLKRQKKFDQAFKQLQEAFNDREAYLIINAHNKVLAASDKKLVGTALKYNFITKEVALALKQGHAYIHPKYIKEDSRHLLEKIFFLTALYDSTQNPIAVIAIGVNPGTMIKITQDAHMGQSGETYVINTKAQLITNSRFDEELRKLGLIKKNQSSFLHLKIAHNGKKTLAAKEVLEQKNGYNIQGYLDYRGVPVFGAWVWDHELHFGIITEIDKAEAISSLNRLKSTIYAVVFSILGFVIILLVFIVWFSNQARKGLEQKVKERTKELNKQLRIVKIAERKQNELITLVNEQKKFFQTLLDSQEQIIITTDGEHIHSANRTFFDFFAVDELSEFNELFGPCICNTFDTKAPKGYLQATLNGVSWIDHLIHSREPCKVKIIREGQEFIFSVSGTILPGDENLKSAVFSDITILEQAKIEIEHIHKHTKESIEYASLIQGALIPQSSSFAHYFSEHFALWYPKDTIGGDIYLFEEINDNEALLMVIDCTGHGVPGAFVTMLVKAIERQITARIRHEKESVSPAKLLSVFNKSMKHLLKQETLESISNVGFDGAILYYNKKEQLIRYAGAEVPLYYVQDDTIQTIKPDHYSVGYKKCAMDYTYTDHDIPVKPNMCFYLTTDGYIDQNGGEKGFPFGKRRFKELILKHYKEPIVDQKEIFLYELARYQKDEERNDDITLVGFKI